MTAARALFDACVEELSAAWQAQPDKPEETPASTIAALWLAACGTPVSVKRALGESLPDLDDAGTARLRELLRQRAGGMPLAYLVGLQHFMGLELIASEAALIPREETELLGRAALEQLQAIADAKGSATAVDVCTGSGNLALAFAYHEPRARVFGSDLSESAVALAQRNVERTEAAQPGFAARIEFRAGDLLAPFDTSAFHGNVDVLCCNPPYISSARVDTMPGEIIEHEPRLAFDGGPLGIRILQRLVAEAPRFLRPSGWLAFEVGLGQGPGMRKRLEQTRAYDDLREILDRTGAVRALLARAKSSVA